jgi:hypothetical protein
MRVGTNDVEHWMLSLFLPIYQVSADGVSTNSHDHFSCKGA